MREIPRVFVIFRIAFAAILAWPFCAGAAEPSGEQVFKSKCASCHGPHGDGGKKYKKRLEGDLSVGQLSKLIFDTMPESNPGSLSQKEADVVAAYIHEAFYSQTARERNRPARIELARLTVKQYRQAVADLVGSFRPPTPAWKGERGLRAEYFKGRNFGRGSRVLERIDPYVNFDFGTSAPVADKMEPHEFLIRWNGSLLAPDTGEYEFTIHTEHAARLWINDVNRPLIDAWVKSGNDTEYKATLYLIGGRVYPLRLEYSKGKQGVDDSKKEKNKPKSVKSSIKLWWKRPQHVAEPIPSRQLSPTGASETFVCSTDFPPDDRSYGWERGTTISQEWDQAATDAALEAAGYVASRLNEFSGVRDDNPDRIKKLREFCRSFVERAFRRPLTPEQARLFVDKQFEAVKDPELAVKRVVILTLKSPQFLYRELGQAMPAYDTAARLSFAMWDSISDQELLSAAAAGKLNSKDAIAKQGERMLADPRARAKLRQFLLKWVKADQPMDLAKDPKAFPGFDAAVISDLRTSLELFFDDLIASDQADYRQLLLAKDIFLNGRLATFYGVDLPAHADFTRTKLDADRRAGVLTHPYLMASFAHTTASSPIHRGVFLARGVLGLALRPPPEAIAPLSPDLHPSLTTRERVTLQTQSNACMTCHSFINPLGFTLEHFDAVGRYREKENDKPVDATGVYQTRDGKSIAMKDARDLANFLAGNTEAHAAFVEQLFHHLVQQPMRAYGPTTLDDLRKSFETNGFNIRKLAIEIMMVSAMKGRGS